MLASRVLALACRSRSPTPRPAMDSPALMPQNKGNSKQRRSESQRAASPASRAPHTLALSTLCSLKEWTQHCRPRSMWAPHGRLGGWITHAMVTCWALQTKLTTRGACPRPRH